MLSSASRAGRMTDTDGNGVARPLGRISRVSGANVGFDGMTWRH